ncbi:hypothetical protein EYF80_007572 [Liparis tanakae]|uniref:Uncharacterized protein n=1 Tax=Liparis tanakae TaxID=230148 RepID=A0A4Z2IXE3_9TELE|nr:hypothetical protein EYF80_007572 [Liparis tanakae]
MDADPPSAINPSSSSSHLVKETLQLPVALLQLRQLDQQLTPKVEVDQARGAELGPPWLLWTQTVEGLRKGPEEEREDMALIEVAEGNKSRLQGKSHFGPVLSHSPYRREMGQ